MRACVCASYDKLDFDKPPVVALGLQKFVTLLVQQVLSDSCFLFVFKIKLAFWEVTKLCACVFVCMRILSASMCVHALCACACVCEQKPFI